MIYLKKFRLLTGEACREAVADVQNTETHDEDYPAYVFSKIELEQIDFENITIFYGGNGSGKTSLLNVIAEKIGVLRKKEYVKTIFFEQYIEDLCEFETTKGYDFLRNNCKFLSSDDIFDHILTVREDNKGIQSNKYEEKEFHAVVNSPGGGYRAVYPDGVRINFEAPEVHKAIEQLDRFTNAPKKTQRQFVRSRAGEMQRQYSNGENALMFFDKEIEKDALYLLDEPENSMSPRFQLELKTLIEDSVRYKNCQFVIATHSPFILSLFDAKIYNLDATPVTVERWHKLENVRYYYDFFKKNKDLFEGLK